MDLKKNIEKLQYVGWMLEDFINISRDNKESVLCGIELHYVEEQLRSLQEAMDALRDLEHQQWIDSLKI